MSLFELALQKEAERLAESIANANPAVRDEIMARLHRYPIVKGVSTFALDVGCLSKASVNSGK